MKRNLTSKVAIRWHEKMREDQHLEQFHNKKQKSEETTNKQQVLILHYLGILDQFNIATVKKGRLFSQLLNRNDKNTEDYIRYVDGKIDVKGIKTRNNLEYVFNLFEDLGLSNEATKVKADIDKITID